MAPSICRSSRGGRPPRGCGLRSGSKGCARSQTSSLNSHGFVRAICLHSWFPVLAPLLYSRILPMFPNKPLEGERETILMWVRAPAVRAGLDYSIDATRSPLSHSLSISTPVERLSERLLAPQRAPAMAGPPPFPWRGRTPRLNTSITPDPPETCVHPITPPSVPQRCTPHPTTRYV